ncbi:MAG: TrpR-like protein, YerC/YecD [Clostridia bacterium]|nr:TrpR-like protein, YerC/YecD [Clostridia bacterium]
MAKDIKDEKIDYLFNGILSLNSVEECYAFFQDLCTVAEIGEMSRRLHAAKMLYNNSVYTEVASQTGLSTATISRVNRCLKYGSDGYITVLDRLENKDE